MPLLDTAQLDAMASDSPDLLLPIVTDFETSARDSLAKLQAAVATNDLAQAKGILHQLKGASGTMGLLAFQNLCRECEEQSKGGTVPSNIDELTPLLTRSVQAAAAYLTAS